jgi:hypothetical protein
MQQFVCQLTQMIHAGWTAGRERCRNGANPSNGQPQSARMNLDDIATEVPAQQAFAGSGLDLE